MGVRFGVLPLHWGMENEQGIIIIRSAKVKCPEYVSSA